MITIEGAAVLATIETCDPSGRGSLGRVKDDDVHNSGSTGNPRVAQLVVPPVCMDRRHQYVSQQVEPQPLDYCSSVGTPLPHSEPVDTPLPWECVDLENLMMPQDSKEDTPFLVNSELCEHKTPS